MTLMWKIMFSVSIQPDNADPICEHSVSDDSWDDGYVVGVVGGSDDMMFTELLIVVITFAWPIVWRGTQGRLCVIPKGWKRLISDLLKNAHIKVFWHNGGVSFLFFVICNNEGVWRRWERPLFTCWTLKILLNILKRQKAVQSILPVILSVAISFPRRNIVYLH